MRAEKTTFTQRGGLSRLSRPRQSGVLCSMQEKPHNSALQPTRKARAEGNVGQFVRRALSQRQARHVTAARKKIRKTDKRLRAFVHEVTAALLDGKRHQTPGLGTFSTCTRKATAARVAFKMAMFR